MREKDVLLTTFIKRKFSKIKNNNFTKSNLTKKGNRARWEKPKSNGSSKYKGVSWRKDCNKWTANITVGGKHKRLGVFKTEELAAEAYNKAVDEFWDGEGFKISLEKICVKLEIIFLIKILTTQEMLINMAIEELETTLICRINFLLEKELMANYIRRNILIVKKKQL